MSVHGEPGQTPVNLVANIQTSSACCAMQELSNVVPGAKWGLEMRGNEHKSKAPGRGVRLAGARSAMNEVVCGAMMLAYERAGKWDEVMLCA